MSGYLVHFAVTADESEALHTVTREHFDRSPDQHVSSSDVGSTVLALVRFALAHLNDPAGGQPRFPPEPRAATATGPRFVAGGKVRVFDRPGHPDGALVVWRDVKAHLPLTDSQAAPARLTELPLHVPPIGVDSLGGLGGLGGAPIRFAISVLDLERFGRDLDPVKHTKTIARARALVEEIRTEPTP